MNCIDIHSHVLPGLDDGARTLEESVAMLRTAAAAGTTDIVASPHANQHYAFDPNVVQQKIDEVQAASGGAPRIHYGCDFHLTPENIDNAVREPERYSIDHNGYLLVEFSDHHIPKTVEAIFGRLMRANMRPIVTHPERNPMLQRRLEDLKAWVSQGVLIQVTAQSFLGRFGDTAKRVTHELMARGLAHFVASDAHDIARRTTALDGVYRYVAEEFGEEAAVSLFERNPRAALAGVSIPMRSQPFKRRKSFIFW